MLKRFLPLLILLALACEGDDARLKRLQADEAIASLEVLMYQHRADSTAAALADSLKRADPKVTSPTAYQWHPAYLTVADSLLSAKRRQQLAERELRNFLND